MNFDVEIFKIEGKGKLVAFADVTFGGLVKTKGWKLFDGQRGVFVTRPSQPGKEEGKYYDTVLITEDKDEGAFCGPFETAVRDAIIQEYKSSGKTSGKVNSSTQAPSSRQAAAKAQAARGSAPSPEEDDIPPAKPVPATTRRPSKATSWAD